MKWLIEVHRAFQSPTVRFGPFDTAEEARAFSDEHLEGLGLIQPMNDPANGCPAEIWASRAGVPDSSFS